MKAYNPVLSRWRCLPGCTVAIALTALGSLPAWANPPVTTPAEAQPPMAQAMDALPLESVSLDAAPMDSAPMNFESTDSVPMDSVPMDSGTMDSGAMNPGVMPSRSLDAGLIEDYLLGSGDLINLDIFNVPEHSGPKRVLVDGSISLAWVGNVPVAGLTLEQAAQQIALAYGRHLRQPTITVSLVTPRPVQVSVAGAVNRPGAYPMTFTSTNSVDGEAEQRWPTVTQALQQAGGISPLANVRQITVQRPMGQGRTQTLNLDLWDLLVAGNLSQDLPLRDGDTILVPTAPRIDAAESRQLALASFSPATIRVTVVGEVKTPGVIEVPPNTPLNQALMAAGGFDNSRAQTGTVDLMRLNADGTVSQREIPVNFSQGIDDETNPVLYPNDVLVVQPSGNAQFSDAANGILGTLGLIVPFLDLFLP
ncbi:MAG: SLBB domain-containing protein [Spirulina sp.]